MSKVEEMHFTLDRAMFFEIGRVLQRNWRVADLGSVSLSVKGGKLTIMTERGGGEIDCEGGGQVSAQLSASQFRKLITAEREKHPSGKMQLTFRPEFAEVATDVAGVKARFP